MERSEAEREELSAASGVTVDQGAESNLVGNSETRQAFNNDADDDAKHGGAAIEALGPLELLHMDGMLCIALKDGFGGWGVGHGWGWV
jgi:hypothetical protein